MSKRKHTGFRLLCRALKYRASPWLQELFVRRYGIRVRTEDCICVRREVV